jgi:hypothetical protein
MRDHADELGELPISERVAILAELLPYPLETIRS